MIVNTEHDLNVYKNNYGGNENTLCCAKPGSHPEEQNGRLTGSIKATLSSNKIDYNEYTGSFKIYAIKD